MTEVVETGTAPNQGAQVNAGQRVDLRSSYFQTLPRFDTITNNHDWFDQRVKSPRKEGSFQTLDDFAATINYMVSCLLLKKPIDPKGIFTNYDMVLQLRGIFEDMLNLPPSRSRIDATSQGGVIESIRANINLLVTEIRRAESERTDVSFQYYSQLVVEVELALARKRRSARRGNEDWRLWTIENNAREHLEAIGSGKSQIGEDFSDKQTIAKQQGEQAEYDLTQAKKLSGSPTEVERILETDVPIVLSRKRTELFTDLLDTFAQLHPGHREAIISALRNSQLGASRKDMQALEEQLRQAGLADEAQRLASEIQSFDWSMLETPIDDLEYAPSVIFGTSMDTVPWDLRTTIEAEISQIDSQICLAYTNPMQYLTSLTPEQRRARHWEFFYENFSQSYRIDDHNQAQIHEVNNTHLTELSDLSTLLNKKDNVSELFSTNSIASKIAELGPQAFIEQAKSGQILEQAGVSVKRYKSYGGMVAIALTQLVRLSFSRELTNDEYQVLTGLGETINESLRGLYTLTVPSHDRLKTFSASGLEPLIRLLTTIEKSLPEKMERIDFQKQPKIPFATPETLFEPLIFDDRRLPQPYQAVSQQVRRGLQELAEKDPVFFAVSRGKRCKVGVGDTNGGLVAGAVKRPGQSISVLPGIALLTSADELDLTLDVKQAEKLSASHYAKDYAAIVALHEFMHIYKYQLREAHLAEMPLLLGENSWNSEVADSVKNRLKVIREQLLAVGSFGLAHETIALLYHKDHDTVDEVFADVGCFVLAHRNVQLFENEEMRLFINSAYEQLKNLPLTREIERQFGIIDGIIKPFKENLAVITGKQERRLTTEEKLAAVSLELEEAREIIRKLEQQIRDLMTG